ncbi:MAG TPA: hypothetical protein VI386_04420 [Candidatus Sulfotelmatobacter sp.]
MIRFPCTAAALIFAILAAALFSASALALCATASGHEMGRGLHAACHPVGGHHPLQPVNHQCCVAGHQTAIVDSAFVGPNLVVLRPARCPVADLYASVVHPVSLASASPPLKLNDPVPLRI